MAISLNIWAFYDLKLMLIGQNVLILAIITNFEVEWCVYNLFSQFGSICYYQLCDFFPSLCVEMYSFVL